MTQHKLRHLLNASHQNMGEIFLTLATGEGRRGEIISVGLDYIEFLSGDTVYIIPLSQVQYIALGGVKNDQRKSDL